jgi:hypothetical protein
MITDDFNAPIQSMKCLESGLGLTSGKVSECAFYSNTTLCLEDERYYDWVRIDSLFIKPVSTLQYVRNDLDPALGYSTGYVRCPVGKVLTGLAFTHDTNQSSAKAGVVPRCGTPSGFTVDSSNEVKARTFASKTNAVKKGTHYEMDESCAQGYIATGVGLVGMRHTDSWGTSVMEDSSSTTDTCCARRFQLLVLELRMDTLRGRVKSWTAQMQRFFLHKPPNP